MRRQDFKKIKINKLLLIIPALLFLYLLFFPERSGRELVLKPEWAIDLASQEPLEVAGAELSGFRVGDRFGYVTPEGELSYKGQVQHNLALSSEGFINYSSVPSADQDLMLFNPEGQFLGGLPGLGYPFFSQERLFIVAPSGSGIRELNLSGGTLWNLSFTRTITSLAISDKYVLLGFSDGLLQLYEEERCLFELKPEGSRIPIILGCAITRTGQSFAAVFGIDPQQLVYIEKTENRFTPLYYPLGRIGEQDASRLNSLQTNLRRELFLQFSTDGQYLFVENQEGLLNYKVKNRKASSILFPGKLDFCGVGSTPSLFTLISGKKPLTSTGEKQFSLQVVETENRLLLKENFVGQDSFHCLTDKQLLLGIDQYLLKFQLVEM